MDDTRFDRLARTLGAALPRRAALGGLLAGAGLASLAAGTGELDAKGKARRDGVAAQRRKRRKKKVRPCVPSCQRRVCGGDGCGGSCGACEPPTTCDGQGRCVGCAAANDCAAIPCQDAACASGICVYAAEQDGSGCGNGRVCCGGGCINTRSDAANCGGCGQPCGANQTCREGQCIDACDVCATGCAFSSVQAAVAAASPGMTLTLCPGRYAGQVLIGKNLTLLGLGDTPADTVITHDGSLILRVESGATVTLRNLAIADLPVGTTALRNEGRLTLREVHVVDNTCAGNTPIFNAFGGDLTLIDCLVRGNTATIGGGLTLETTATARLVRTRIEGNTALQGGGAYVFGGGTLNVTEGSTITDNTATSGPTFGGGILNKGTVNIDASNVTGNTPDDCVNDGGTGCPA